MIAGVVAGLAIGIVASVLGVAGGELLIPTLVLLFGIDVKLAGSLSLAVSLPTMIVGFARYSRARMHSPALRQERPLMGWMMGGSVLGAAIGGMLLGARPDRDAHGTARHRAARLGRQDLPTFALRLNDAGTE